MRVYDIAHKLDILVCGTNRGFPVEVEMQAFRQKTLYLRFPVVRRGLVRRKGYRVVHVPAILIDVKPMLTKLVQLVKVDISK